MIAGYGFKGDAVLPPRISICWFTTFACSFDTTRQRSDAFANFEIEPRVALVAPTDVKTSDTSDNR